MKTINPNTHISLPSCLKVGPLHGLRPESREINLDKAYTNPINTPTYVKPVF